MLYQQAVGRDMTGIPYSVIHVIDIFCVKPCGNFQFISFDWRQKCHKNNKNLRYNFSWILIGVMNAFVTSCQFHILYNILYHFLLHYIIPFLLYTVTSAHFRSSYSPTIKEGTKCPCLLTMTHRKWQAKFLNLKLNLFSNVPFTWVKTNALLRIYLYLILFVKLN